LIYDDIPTLIFLVKNFLFPCEKDKRYFLNDRSKTRHLLMTTAMLLLKSDK